LAIYGQQRPVPTGDSPKYGVVHLIQGSIPADYGAHRRIMNDEFDFGGGLIDLSGLTLREVGLLDDSPLSDEVAELVGTDGRTITAGFNSFI
jgi:hypothetical protein